MTNKEVKGVTLLWDMPEEEIGLYRWQKAKVDRCSEVYGKVYGPDFVVYFMHEYGKEKPMFEVNVVDPYSELSHPFYITDAWYMGDKGDIDIPLHIFTNNKDLRKWFNKVALPIIFKEMDKRAVLREIVHYDKDIDESKGV